MARPRRLADSIREIVDLPRGPLLVALSGGADSSVLAWLANTSTDSVRAVFVDHHLEGSGLLREAAQRVADAYDIALDVVDAPVDPDAPSFEDTARRARYAALLAAAKPEETILTGHTSDDLAETVLGNFLRGAGAAGLAGIPAVRGRICRPLLDVSRQQTREVAAELGLPFADDPENDSQAPRRNRLRNTLIPQLENEFNPALRAALGRTARVMAADEQALERLANRIPVVHDGEVVALPAPALASVEPAVAARAVRRALRAVRGPHAGTLEEVAAVVGVAMGTQRGAELAGGLRVEREGPMVVIGGETPPPVGAVALSGPAGVEFDRWKLEVETRATRPRPWPLGHRTLLGDADVIGSDLVLRPAADGDRVDIRDGSKLVDDALAERGVPRRLRRRWPVVAAGERVALIPGVRVAAWASPTATTARYLQIRMDVRH